MIHGQSTQEYSERASLAALGMLEPEEWSAFKSHLDEGCEVCRKEFESFQEVAGDLGFAARAVRPRPEVRVRVLSSVRPLNEQPRVAQHIPRPGRAFPAAQSRFVLLAAAAMLVITLGSAFLYLQSRKELARLETQLAQLRIQAKRQEQLLAAMTSPNHETFTLAGQGTAASAQAQIVWDREASRWVLDARNLPRLSRDQTFQLWIVTKDAKISAGTFQADQSGTGFFSAAVPPDLSGIQAAAVSIEPQGGVIQPTGPICLAGATSQRG